MSTVHCPLCGLRFRHCAELDQHARDEHAPAAAPERRETVHVHPKRVTERPLDRVLGRH